MQKDRQSLEFLELLNLETNETIDPRLLLWARAFQFWIAERRSVPSPSIGKDAFAAWRDFLAMIPKPPWEIEPADVQAYLESLQSRKLRPGTIGKRLNALSQFYACCQTNRVDPGCEAGFNPVQGVRKPAERRYEKVNYLSKGAESALLEAIRQDPSVLGKRDYALFLALLRTGWKAVRVRQLRWGEINAKGEKSPQVGLPQEVLSAIHEYLEASGRLDGIRDRDYVFVPSKDPLLREAGSNAQDWDANRPISVWQLRLLLKKAAARAGLRSGAITCHTLRHTAAIRRLQAGESEQAVQSALDLKSARHLNESLAWLKKRQKRLNKRPLPAGEIEPPPSRGPCWAKPRNHLRLTHGLRARYLPEFEWLAGQGVKLDLADANVLRWRVVLRRLLLFSKDTQDLDRAIYFLDVAGIAARRLVKGLEMRRQLRKERLKYE
jgi:integrase/recombinase XerD